MSEIAGDAAAAQPPNGTGESRGSPTRGFLFADIRDYTRYVETHGAAAAADLLTRYRRLVRDAVGQFDGSEIRTEGDSFFVVFPAVSAAVQCGLAIVAAAATRPIEVGVDRIPVGIGIHAGETVETAEGYVGGPVNVAARICAVAQPGEVLVSDTVRSLTRTVLPVTFVDRGRRQLKGVADPVPVFAVMPAGTVAARRRPWAGLPRPARIGVAIAVPVAIVLVVVLLVAAIRPAAGLPPGTWKIGMDVPLSGPLGPHGGPMRDAAQLAVDDANAAGGVFGSKLVFEAHDDGGNNIPQGQSPTVGAANMTAMANDPSIVAVVGPRSSRVAEAEIPISNRSGLLQCTPAGTLPDLTKPRDGALDLRSAFPDRINFIRTAPSDDIQGVALASFLFNDLGAKTTLVIDDTGDGRAIADQVTAAYEKLGGTVIRRALNPGSDPSTVIDPLSGSSDPPGAVFFGGFTETGAWNVRLAMVTSGHGSIPFVSWDGIQDGSGADQGSFIQHAGTAAAGSYFSHATIGPPLADFDARFRARFGQASDEYIASSYACTQVIIDSLRAVAANAPSADGLREAVRAYAVDPSHRYDTVIGTVGFDGNGDSRQQYVTFYKVDMSAENGLGDWVVDKQQDYGPAP
jgi:branched-chain amino acid transport system substrate-binding protein